MLTHSTVTLLALVFCSITGRTYAQAAFEQEDKVIYPRAISQHDRRTIYPIKLLELAIQKSNKSYYLISSKAPMTQSRALKTLVQQDGVDIVWTMTTADREKNYLPIRIPIYQGLLGWRIFLIRAQEQTIFNKIKNLSGLKKRLAGQGHDWPDSQILEDSGIRVINAPNYDALFDMLDKGRFDFFPRSLVEIWEEIAVKRELNIGVENTLLLRYPSAMYFFVDINNRIFANDIEQGLKVAISDGTFQQIFMQYHQNILQKSQLHMRTIIDIPNRQLPKLTPLNDATLWYQSLVQPE